MKLKKLLSTLSVMMLTFSFSMSNSVAVHANNISTWNFSYTGSVQTFTAPYSGKYNLEVWGAQGGSGAGYVGGAGGYSSGEVTLTKGQAIYVYVGGQGRTNIGWVLPNNSSYGGWNGGGGADATGNNESGTQASGGGGGATDVRIGSQALTNRVIVAGGGGGIGLWASGTNTAYANGGYGGGLTGGTQDLATGGTQTSGYALGQGGSGSYTTTDVDFGGGGGGYYGGNASYGTSDSQICGGGGGSGYIGGVQKGNSIAGNTTMPSPSGGTEVGQSGNGYARITSMSPYAKGIVINKRADDLEVGETDKLTASVIPDNALVKTVKWTSSDPSVVTVDDNGNIAAVKAGIAIITATVQDGRNLHGQCRVCVTN